MGSFSIDAIGENKNTEFNHAAPIDLDTIPLDKREQALKEFAEGSLGLENCLRAMWANNLKTFACCAGELDDYDIAYIGMSPGVDVFGFLSEELLMNDMVALEVEDSRQIMRFGGTKEYKDKLMQQVADDILSGKKQNEHQVQNKIGKGLNKEWINLGRINSMRKLGMSEDEIREYERELELRQIVSHGTEDEVNAVWPEYLQLVAKMNDRVVEVKARQRG